MSNGRDNRDRDNKDRGDRNRDGDSRFGAPPKPQVVRESANGGMYVDYKDVESLRRMMSPNGKIYGRKRLGTTAREQKMVAQAIKRARYMGLLPFTSATM